MGGNSTYLDNPALTEVKLPTEVDAPMFAAFPELDRMLSKVQVFDCRFMQTMQFFIQISRNSQGSCSKTPT